MLQRHNNNTHTHSIQETNKQQAIYFHSLLLSNEDGINNNKLKKELEEKKSLVNATDANGLTPLQSLMNHFAHLAHSLEDFRQSALLLIEHGADIYVRDTTQSQATIAHHLVLSNKNGVNDEAIKALHKQDKEFLNEKNGAGLTPLQALMGNKCLLRDFKKTVLLLASLGADLTVFDSNHDTVMHRSVVTNKDGVNEVEIRALHEKNNELVNTVNGQGLTPLQSLMQHSVGTVGTTKSFKKTALLLAELKANLNVVSHHSAQTLLHFLVLANKDGVNNAEIAKVLEINKELVHAKNGKGLTPLQSLLAQFEKGDVSLKDMKETAFILAAAGANFAATNGASYVQGGIQYRDKPGTFLHHLVLTNQEVMEKNDQDVMENKGVNDDDIARFLEMFPDLVDVKNGLNSRTPLVSLMLQFDEGKCSLKSFKRTARILLAKGADPVFVDSDGTHTLLHYLVATNTANVNDEAIEELVKARPDLLDVADGEGYTPIQRLVAKKDASKAAVEKLLALGASLQAKCQDLTLLELACKAGNLNVAKLLVEKGLTVKDHIDADNVHDCFSAHKNEELWKWLADENDLDYKNKDVNGQNLVHQAVAHYNSSLVKWLIKRNVDLNVIDNKGETPLNIAERQHDKQSSLHLKRAGAKVSTVGKLFEAIEEMKRYGETLKRKDAAKATVAIDLAERLQSKANELLKLHEGKVNLAAFKKEFEELSHTKDQEMSVYRESWGKILLNLALALTGVGLIAIVGKLIYSEMTTGRPTFFGQRSETTRETKLADVRSAAIKVGA